jgi:hypothetical protein
MPLAGEDRFDVNAGESRASADSRNRLDLIRSARARAFEGSQCVLVARTGQKIVAIECAWTVKSIVRHG